MMTLKRFRHLADSYGGDLRRWPAETRDDAAALLRQEPTAARVIRDAQSTDHIVENALARHKPAESELAQAAERLQAKVMSRISEVEQIPAWKFRFFNRLLIGTQALWDAVMFRLSWREQRFASCFLCAMSCATGLWFGFHSVDVRIDHSMMSLLDTAFLGSSL